jgi:Carotenoid biosynthesis protein
VIKLELAAYAIIVLFVAVRARFGPEPRSFLRRLALLAVASFLVEDSVIHAYGFYFYDDGWTVFIDRVPLAVLLIWPVVIHSSWELARALLTPEHAAVPLVGGLLVWADASLIEPISVRSGLWTWTQPGLFDVPPIGILGWAFYASLCMVVFQYSESRRSATFDMLTWIVPQLGTHALLLASWWGLFRWVNTTWSAWPVVAIAWSASLGLAFWAIRVRARNRVLPRDLLTRVPAASFFFVLLALNARDDAALVAYALAFAPPYLTLMQKPSAWRLRDA